MTIKSATPYLILNGKAQQAIELYRTALQANVEVLQRFGDMPGGCPEALKDRVMHAAIRVGSAVLMLSDGGPDGGPTAPGSGPVSVALDLDDEAQLRRIFDALAASGKVVQPVIDAPWGALFGAVNDAFGISWMFNCTKAPR
ncbi:MAG TPA: VOC family protein [Polyangiaceae bacterium]|nr:VOC family protein [Polyangiaceae bacterium]